MLKSCEGSERELEWRDMKNKEKREEERDKGGKRKRRKTVRTRPKCRKQTKREKLLFRNESDSTIDSGIEILIQKIRSFS